MQLNIVSAALILGLIAAPPVAGQSWSTYDKSHAIARDTDFYVLRENGACTVKQSYYDNPSRMELVYREGGYPTLIAPFMRKPDQVIYEVDPEELVPKNRVPSRLIEASNVIRLPKDVVGDLKRGRTLKVMAQIDGQWLHVQTFSLMGFTAAVQQLSGPRCN